MVGDESSGATPDLARPAGVLPHSGFGAIRFNPGAGGFNRLKILIAPGGHNPYLMPQVKV